MPPLEETPSMIQLDTPQFWEVVLLIFGAESIVGGGRREGGGYGSGANDESVILAADGIQDGRVENEHRASQEDETRGRAVSF